MLQRPHFLPKVKPSSVAQTAHFVRIIPQLLVRDLERTEKNTLRFLPCRQIVIQNMDYKGYAALGHVLTHTRDTVIKRQTLELEKLQRENSRLNYSYRSLIEYNCIGQTPPHYCQKCGSWECPDHDATWYFFKFYSELGEYDSMLKTWVLEKVFLCNHCAENMQCSWPEAYLKLCTKYKFSYWCEGNDYSCVRQFVEDKDFEDAENYGHLRKFVLGNQSKFYHDFFLNHKPDKMHHVAAYIIQRAFRCGWDYRHALDEPESESDPD